MSLCWKKYDWKNLMMATLVILCPGTGVGTSLAPNEPCLVEGYVEDVRERVETFEGPKWRGYEPRPPAITYTDVYLRVSLKRVKPGHTPQPYEDAACDFSAGGIEVYQLVAGERKPRKGDKIRGWSQFEGDEFFHGNWLRDIEPLMK